MIERIEKQTETSIRLIYGAGGHGKVVLDTTRAMQLPISFLLDDAPRAGEVTGIRVYRSSEVDLATLHPFTFIVGIGANTARSRVFARLSKIASPFTAIHPFSSISGHASIGQGVAILAGAVINVGARIEDNVIINTGATIDHDCMIGAHVHICPGVRLAGTVSVGEGTMIGTGAVAIPGVTIGANCIIGAGAVVIEDIPPNSVAFGNPARVMRPNSPTGLEASNQ